MAWTDYLLVVSNITKNHGSLADTNTVRLFGDPIGDDVSKLIYAPTGGRARILSSYGLTDGKIILTEPALSGKPLVVDKTRIKPYEPLENADMVMLSDGRVFVEDIYLNGDGKLALKRVKQLAPELYSEFSLSRFFAPNF